MTVRETWFLFGFGAASSAWASALWMWARGVRRELTGHRDLERFRRDLDGGGP